MLQQLTSRLQVKSRDAGERTLRREARYFAGLISKKLEQLDICYRYRKNERDLIERGVKRVSFKIAVTQDEAIWLMIDTSPRQLPRGVSLHDINDSKVLNDLSVACARPVRFKQNIDGAWLVIERETGVFGIRSRIEFGDMMKNWPDNKVLQVPLGLAANRKLVFRSLDEFPHALIGGATKSGKTTLTHAWICALALHNKPQLLNLVLIDLKGGVEFTRYKKLPHLWHFSKCHGETLETFDGFVKDRDDVVPVLEILRREMDRRLDMFERAGGVQSIAALMLEPDLKKGAERCLADLGARGRAPGIHFVIATQRPEVSVVSGRIKGNLDARFGFRVPDNASSMVIMDDTSAAQFPDGTPRGRFIFKFGNDRKEVQGPWIGPGKIRSIVNSVIDGDSDLQSESAQFDPEEIFRTSLRELGGAMSINKLYKILKGKGVSKRYISTVASDYEGEIVDVDGVLYELQPSPEQFEPRRLVAIEGPGISEKGRDNDSVTGSGTQNGAQSGTAMVSGVQNEPQLEDDAFRIMRYALENMNGVLSERMLYRNLRGQISKNDLKALLKECELMPFTIDGEIYVVNPGAGRRPRQLVNIQEMM